VRRTEDLRFLTGRGWPTPLGAVVGELPRSAANIARWIREARQD
jgi:hypothetical protein